MNMITFPNNEYDHFSLNNEYDKLSFSRYVLGRNPEIWGKRYPVDDFEPKRWMEREKYPSNYAYPQFNAGPRLCLGKGLAMLEIKLGLCLMLDEFEVPIGKWKVSFFF